MVTPFRQSSTYTILLIILACLYPVFVWPVLLFFPSWSRLEKTTFWMTFIVSLLAIAMLFVILTLRY